MTFSGIVGGATNGVIEDIKVGATDVAGSADFNAAVTATTLTVTGGGAAAEDTTATFSSTVTITTIDLQEANSGQEAIVVFDDATAAQTIAANIDGVSGAEGRVDVLAAARLVTFTGVVGGSDGFHIFRLTGRRHAHSQDFKDVKEQIRHRIFRQKRRDVMKSFLEELRAKTTFELDDEALAAIKVAVTKNAAKKPRSEDHTS